MYSNSSALEKLVHWAGLHSTSLWLVSLFAFEVGFRSDWGQGDWDTCRGEKLSKIHENIDGLSDIERALNKSSRVKHGKNEHHDGLNVQIAQQKYS